MSDDALQCPECPVTFPRRKGYRLPESWRGVRQRLTKHRRKAHGYPSPDELRAMKEHPP